MWQSAFTEQYGLDVPLISAGMGFLARPELVAAVSNAGGLGLLGAAPAPAPQVHDMIRRVKTLTSRPFGVDFLVEDIAFGPLTTEEHIAVCLAEHVPVVVFFWHLPPREWLAQLQGAGTRVWMQVGTVDAAREAVQMGIDALIVQGSEAGGHNRSLTGLWALLPAVVDAVAPVPVIAAGGIADGRGVAAALALGAAAVCVGTRFIASQEAYAHPEYKQRLVTATLADSTRTCLFGPEWPDQPMRVLRNRVVQAWAGRDAKTPPSDPSLTIGRTLLGGQEYHMPQFSAILPTPETTGDLDEMCLAAGAGVELVRAIIPAEQIVRDMMAEASELIARRLMPLISSHRGA